MFSTKQVHTTALVYAAMQALENSKVMDISDVDLENGSVVLVYGENPATNGFLVTITALTGTVGATISINCDKRTRLTVIEEIPQFLRHLPL
jgi:hypothetical protein